MSSASLGKSTLTREEAALINERAADLARSASREEISRIPEMMDPQVLQSLKENGTDPVIHYFRTQAERQIHARETGGATSSDLPMTDFVGSIRRTETRQDLEQQLSQNEQMRRQSEMRIAKAEQVIVDGQKRLDSLIRDNNYDVQDYQQQLIMMEQQNKERFVENYEELLEERDELLSRLETMQG